MKHDTIGQGYIFWYRTQSTEIYWEKIDKINLVIFTSLRLLLLLLLLLKEEFTYRDATNVETEM